MKIENVCKGCGEKFEVPFHLKDRKYCSTECYQKHRIKNNNEYIIKDDYCELHIKNKETGRYIITLLSLTDIDKVKKGQWWAFYDKTIKNYYIRGRIGKTQIQLHRYLTNCPENMQVDHINRNTVDNRQENLRIVTNKENSHNKSQCGISNKFNDKGISYHKRRKRYCVHLDGYNIGTFETLEQAKDAKQLYLKGEWELKPKRVYKKRVRCVETGIIYNSISEASKDMNINRSGIELCCRGKREATKGYHWEVLPNTLAYEVLPEWMWQI